MLDKSKLGTRYVCFQCGTKFYDLNRPEPTCPECGANQQEAPIRSWKEMLAGGRSDFDDEMTNSFDDDASDDDDDFDGMGMDDDDDDGGDDDDDDGGDDGGGGGGGDFDDD
ncbi:MAG: FYDLN acid domain-containing protein [Alphaproteobacteria bacterium]|nr:FYDLN acid domain-containing protein [Alphaproteobacteria bacterium]